jgi:UDP-galactopyranose mutase
MPFEPDILVVGAGLSGLSFARKYAEDHPREQVHIIDKRSHIGGNCHDFIGEYGILVQKYGPHIFHTNEERVWSFLSRFTEWIAYRHRGLAKYRGQHYPMPINRTTINKFFGKNLKTESEVREFLDTVREHGGEIRNSRDVVVSRFGEELYNAFIRDYSLKQWGVSPTELQSFVLERLPIRYDDNDSYYNAKYEGIPSLGFTFMFSKMADLENIRIFLDTDFFDFRKNIKKETPIVYTGRLDEFFGYKHGILPYRHSRFIFESLDTLDFQPNSVVNYVEPEPEYIRVTEFKKLYMQDAVGTVICREYSGDEGIPTYPMPLFGVEEKIQKYLSCSPENMCFMGRLGLHRYLDMDRACSEALDLAEEMR